jgi:hypothetical protein
MTTKDEVAVNTPFLLRFSEPIPHEAPVRMKYDPVRQMVLVDIDGQWVDSTLAKSPQVGTRLTKVDAETTDDE